MFQENSSEEHLDRPEEAGCANLLDRARGGDTDSLIELLRMVTPAVRKSVVVSPKWQNAFDIDDVLQATFSEVFLRMDRFVGENRKAFETWVTTIAQNCTRSAIRALQCSKRPPQDRRLAPNGDSRSATGGLLADICITTGTPSRAVASMEVNSLILAALKKLPPDYACVIRLYYFEGIAGEELGKKLGRSRGAAFMMLGRARDYLAEVLGRESQFFSGSA